MWVEIILPVPVHSTFTYLWNAVSAPMRGIRVHVSFGRQKCLMGVVHTVRSLPPDYECKPILRVLDEFPRIQSQQIDLWNWIADYYICPIGEVMQSALPAFFKLENEDIGPFTLGDGSVVHWRWSSKKHNEGRISEVFAELSRAKMQTEALLSYFQICSTQIDSDSEFYPWISQSILQEYSTIKTIHLSALKDKGYLEKSRIYSDVESVSNNKKIKLSEAQEIAFMKISSGLLTKRPVLLQGQTGSGKTEIYLKLAYEILEKGKHVLMLVPEIALTTQLHRRLEISMGLNVVCIYHSQVSESQRRDTWLSLLNPSSGAKLVLAARSGVFLPMEHVGLIIVDEEHETSYKQYEPSPRYHARDVAVWLSNQIGAGVVLGSATPSLETFNNSIENKYCRIELSERFGKSEKPIVKILSLVKYKSLKQMEGPFAKPVFDAIGETLGLNQQVLVFQNRRGYSPFLTCMSCGWTEPCADCDVAVTYHKKTKSLKCHYCGQSRELSNHCPSCQKSAWQLRGIGTERIEENLESMFPEAHIIRVDSDTTRKKKSMSHFIDWLETGKVDIVVGTQMIGKGLDISGLSLAVIVNADNALQMPDFRAHERAFQLFTQVAGRTGRREDKGHVIIQTATPEHPILLAVKSGKYNEMAMNLLEDRRVHHYPPFVKLIRIELRHRKEIIVYEAANFLAQKLLDNFRGGVLGPDEPSVSRIKNMYLQHIWMKFPSGKGLTAMKDKLRKINNSLFFSSDFKSVKIIMDVDPY